MIFARHTDRAHHRDDGILKDAAAHRAKGGCSKNTCTEAGAARRSGAPCLCPRAGKFSRPGVSVSPKRRLSRGMADKKTDGALWKMPKSGGWNCFFEFVKRTSGMQNRQNAEKLLHSPGRFIHAKKLAQNPEKGLTTGLLPCILNQYHKNGIERPKRIEPLRQPLKLCEKCRMWFVSRPVFWVAFTSFVNLWNRSGRVL